MAELLTKEIKKGGKDGKEKETLTLEKEEKVNDEF